MDTPSVLNTEPIEHMVDHIGVDSVFGQPTKEGDVTVIPVAQVTYGFGYGGGYGHGVNGDSEEAEVDEAEMPGEGAGGGAGAGGRATPRGFIRISADGVSYQSISDEMRVPLAGIFMIVWSVFWVTWTIRSLIKAVARRKKTA